MRNKILIAILTIGYYLVQAQCPKTASCNPGNTQDFFGCGIFNFTLNTINKNSGDANEGYKDFSCNTSTSLLSGTVYTVNITTGSTYDENVRVWIDYNNDATFSTNESVFLSTNKKSHVGQITISSTAILNIPLRLRVASDYQNIPNNPCTTPEYSQVEDYSVLILPNGNKPQTEFSSNTIATCTGVVNFTDQSQNIPRNWKWFFGDGDSSNLQNPTHTYKNGGLYDVTLITSNSAGTDTLTKTDFIIYNSTSPKTISCKPSTVNYCCGYGITQVLFNGINNQSADATNGYEDFTCGSRTTLTQGKRYNFSVTTGSVNNEDVHVYIDYNNDGTFNETNELAFNFLSNKGSVTYSYLVPNNTIVNTPIRLRVISDYSGNSITACKNPDKGQVEDYTITFVNSQSPPVSLFYADSTVSCSKTINFFDVSDNTPTSWHWDFGDSTFSTLQNPNHLYSKAGTYTVKLKTCNTYGCDSIVKPNYIRFKSPCYCIPYIKNNNSNYIYSVKIGSTDYISANPNINYTEEVNPSAQIIIGSAETIKITSYSAGFLFAWIDYNGNGVFEASENIVNIESNGGGENEVKYITSSNLVAGKTKLRVVFNSFNNFNSCPTTSYFGETRDYSVTLVKNTSAPKALFALDTLLCNNTLNLIDNSLHVPTSWEWNFGDGTISNLKNPSHTYSSYGKYKVSLKTCNVYGCDSTSTDVLYSTKCPYCIPKKQNNSLTYFLSNVYIRSINNSSGNGLKNGYSNYRNLSTDLVRGNTYPLNVNTNLNVGYLNIWLDYNKNGLFEIAERLIINSQSVGYNYLNITIPKNSTTGNTVCRIIYTNQVLSADSSCPQNAFNEIEDYTIQIIDPIDKPEISFNSIDTNTCNSAITFTSITNNLTEKWFWDFGDGNTDTSQNPIHIYADTGVYTIKLKACNAIGCDSLVKIDYIKYADTCTYCIKPYAYPQTIIKQFALNTIKYNSENDYNVTGYYNYKNNSTDLKKGKYYTIKLKNPANITCYTKAWIDFDKNGNFSLDENIINEKWLEPDSNKFTFKVPENAITTPTVLRIIGFFGISSDPCSVDNYGETEDYTVNIIDNNEPPIAQFYSFDSTNCNGIVQFRDTTENISSSWLWDFGDGNNSNLKHPIHAYKDTGNYTVKLKVCNSIACDSVVKPNYVKYGSICSYCKTTFTMPQNYIEQVKIGTINYVNPSVPQNGFTFINNQTTNLEIGEYYDLKIQLKNWVSGYVTAMLDYNNNGDFESGEIIYDNISNDSLYLSFQVPLNSKLGSTRLRIINKTTPIFNGTFCSENFEGETEDYLINIIDNLNKPEVIFTSLDSATCVGNVSFIDYSKHIPTSWFWDFGDGTTSTLQQPVHTYQNYGNYDIKLKVCNKNSCDSVTKSQFVKYSAICTYCMKKSQTYAGNKITGVKLNNINNNNTLASLNGYNYYSSDTTSILLGKNQQITIKTISPYGYLTIWLDQNIDGVFTDSELIYDNALNNYSTVINFKLSNSTKLGRTRMRIVYNTYFTNSSGAACNTEFQSETEDYDVYIKENTLKPKTDFTADNFVICNGFVNFRDSTENNPNTWFWDFGDGNTSTIQNPTHYYNAIGNYTVSLKTCNQFGCDSLQKNNFIRNSLVCNTCNATGMYSNNFYINEVTINTLTNKSSIGVNGYSNFNSLIAYLDIGQNFPLTISTNYSNAYYYAWIDYDQNGQFDSYEQLVNQYVFSNTLTTNNLVPTSAKIGSTTMRVIVSSSPLNSACISINSFYSGEVEDYTVNIVPNIYPPIASFSSPNTLPCNNTVSFTDNSIRNPQTWFWQFGDGSVSFVQNPSHQYLNSGTYSVSLKTCNNNGCDSITNTNFVTINTNNICSYCTPNSQAFFSIYAPVDDVKFNTINNISGHASNIQYTDYSNLSTSVEIGKTYNLEINSSQNSFQYYYAWIDYNRDGNFDNSEQICSTYTNKINMPITISSNSLLGKTKMRIKTSYYYITSNSSTLACSDLEYGEVEDYVIEILMGTLKPNINFTTNSNFNCNGEVYFEDLSTIQPTSWYWDFGDGNTSNLQSPFHKYSSTGQYDVTLKACNSNGCNTKKKLKYIVYTTNCICTPGANATFSYINTVNISDAGIGITNTSTNNLNGYQDFKNIQMDMYENTNYYAYINSNSIGSISGYQYASIFIDLNRDNNLTSDELVYNSSSYNYGFNSTTYLGGNFTLPKLNDYGPTLMRIIVTDDYNKSIDPCVTNTNGEIEDYTVNLSRLKNTRNDIFVYPNPSNGKFTFYYEMFNVEDVNVKLVDVSGHLILENNYSQASEIYENIDISAYNDGLYLLILTTPTTKNSFKVYKKD